METGIEAAPWWPELLEVRDQLPLSALAARFGTTVVALVLAFKRTGTSKTAQAPLGSPKATSSAPRPASRAPAREATGELAWEVRFRGEERPRVLFAEDFSAALGRALRRGDVDSVALLGPAL